MNMTGHWNGLYTYPWGQEVHFEAEIVEIADRLDGSTTELSIFDGSPAPATIAGRRNADLVSFTKIYAKAGFEDAVCYAGVLSADGQEVEGTWTIRPEGSGGFLMIRAEPVREPVAEKAAAKA